MADLTFRDIENTVLWYGQELPDAVVQVLESCDVEIESLQLQLAAERERADRLQAVVDTASTAPEVPEGMMLVSTAWYPIMSEIDRRAEKECGEECDFTVTIMSEEYRAIYHATEGSDNG